MFLIDDLLVLPLKGFCGIFKTIHDMVEREWSDETHIQETLIALRLRFELDEIGEQEYDRQEKELLHRLDAARGAHEEGGEEAFRDG